MCSSFRAALCLPLGHIVKRCGQSHCVSVRRCSGQYQLLLYPPTYMRRPYRWTAPYGKRKEVLSARYSCRPRQAAGSSPRTSMLPLNHKKASSERLFKLFSSSLQGNNKIGAFHFEILSHMFSIRISPANNTMAYPVLPLK